MAFPRKASKAISEGEKSLRNAIFRGCEERLWDKSRDQGFVTIPKTMPFIKRILDEMSINQPLGEVYEILWTYTWSNNGFVRLGNISEMAFAAGFKQQRGERTFRERLKRLAELGFVEIKPHAGNSMGFAFIPNPHKVLLDLQVRVEAASASERANLPNLREESFNAFLARAVDIKAVDVRAYHEQQVLTGDQLRSSASQEPSRHRTKLRRRAVKNKIAAE